MVQNLDSSLAWKLAKITREVAWIYAPAHVVGQILGWKDFLTLLHWVF